MAKIASQILAFQISKAVSSKDSDELDVVSKETITQLLEAVTALIDDGVIVELVD